MATPFHERSPCQTASYPTVRRAFTGKAPCSALSSWRLTTSGSAFANQARRLSSRLLMLLMLKVATFSGSLSAPSAASYPPLHKTQGQGTPMCEVGAIKRPGHPPLKIAEVEETICPLQDWITHKPGMGKWFSYRIPLSVHHRWSLQLSFPVAAFSRRVSTTLTRVAHSPFVFDPISNS